MQVNWLLLTTYGALALLAGALLVQAWRRPDRRRRPARLLASALVPLALALLVRPPQPAPPAGGSREAVLLTPGYSPDSLRALRRRLAPGALVWYYGPDPVPAGARPLNTPLSLAEQRPPLARLHLLGVGLASAELRQLAGLPLVPHPGLSPAGVTAATWPAHLTLGQLFEVEGRVRLPAGARAEVTLWAEGTGRDSLRLPAGGGAFRLRYRPRVAGPALFGLRLRRAGTRRTEPLPLEIARASRPAVLLLAVAPSFEFKFLKNYLAAAGHAVALRAPVSRGLVSTESVNQPAVPLTPLSAATLARYAVVVADAAAFVSLSASENAALGAAVRQGQLGLLVLAGDPAGPLPAALPGRAAFVRQTRPGRDSLPQPLTWADAPSVAPRVRLPSLLRPHPALQAVATGPGRGLVVARRRVGLGALAVSVVPATYAWALGGDTLAYAGFWNAVLGAVQPAPPPAARWEVVSPWPRPHQPLTLRLVGGPSGTERPSVRDSSGVAATLALLQDRRLPEWRTGQFWPRRAGWHEVRGPGPARGWFYVYDSAAWAGPEWATRQVALADRVGPTADQLAASVDGARWSWPGAGWWLALFTLATGFLWLEEKL